MRRILASLLVIGVVGAAGVAASSAFFTDTEVSNNNRLTTGTLMLDVNENGSDGTFVLNLGNISMMPGDDTDDVEILIRNTGSTNLAWFGYFTLENILKDLDKVVYVDNMKMEFLPVGEWHDTDQFITNGDGSGPYPTHYLTLADNDPLDVISLRSFSSSSNNMMGTGPGVFMGALKPFADGGWAYRLTFNLAMHESADNTYQGGRIDLKYKVVATQIEEDAINDVSTGDPVVDFLPANAGAHVNWFNDQIGLQVLTP